MLALSGICIVIAGLSAAWLYLTSQMEAGALQWRQSVLAQGGFVSFGTPQRSGWPLAPTIVLPAFTVGSGVPGGPNSLLWHSDAVRLSLAPWHPFTLQIATGGEQSFKVGLAPPWPITAGSLWAEQPFRAVSSTAIEGRALSISAPDGTVRVERLAIQAGAGFATVALANLALPIANVPFGGVVSSVSTRIEATGELPLPRDPAVALAAWRDAGGLLHLLDVAVRFGPLDMHGQATLHLDRSLQPAGTGEIHVAGWSETIDALARSGTITRAEARVAATVLGLIAGPAAGSGTEASLPVQLNDRTLSVGAIPVVRLPAIALP